MASNNDSGVRYYDMERFQLFKHFQFEWPVNVGFFGFLAISVTLMFYIWIFLLVLLLQGTSFYTCCLQMKFTEYKLHCLFRMPMPHSCACIISLFYFLGYVLTYWLLLLVNLSIPRHKPIVGL
jgi:hypothetical protein